MLMIRDHAQAREITNLPLSSSLLLRLLLQLHHRGGGCLLLLLGCWLLSAGVRVEPADFNGLKE